jgi:hypothetical protein
LLSFHVPSIHNWELKLLQDQMGDWPVRTLLSGHSSLYCPILPMSSEKNTSFETYRRGIFVIPCCLTRPDWGIGLFSLLVLIHWFMPFSNLQIFFWGYANIIDLWPQSTKRCGTLFCYDQILTDVKGVKAYKSRLWIRSNDQQKAKSHKFEWSRKDQMTIRSKWSQFSFLKYFLTTKNF